MRSIMGSKILSSDMDDEEKEAVQEAASDNSQDMTSQGIEDWLTSLQARFDDLAGRRFGVNFGD